MTEPVTFDNTPRIKPGDRGIDVAYYQVMLREVMHESLGSGGPAHDGINGIYSDAMTRVVRDFQAKRGVSTEDQNGNPIPLRNGILNEDTAQILVANFADQYNRNHSPQLPETNGELTPDVKTALERIEPSLAAIKQADTLQGQHPPQIHSPPPEREQPSLPAPTYIPNSPDFIPFTSGRRRT